MRIPTTWSRRNTVSSPVGRVRRAIAAPLTLVLTIAIASQVSPNAAAAAWHRPVPKDVKGIKVQPVVAKPRPVWTASGREFTAKDVTTARSFGGVQTVDLPAGVKVTGRGRQAGRLPVYVAQGSATAPAKVRVKYVTHAAGFGGPALELSRADGVTFAGQVKITVDYASLAGVYNQDARTRLRLVNLADGTPVASTNDVQAGTVSATVAVSGTTTAVGLAAAPAGPNGDYTATSLSAASTWQVSQQTGAFTWAYPIKLPTATGSLAPSVSLSYDSADIDGRTAATNTQGSWVGDGWSLWPGFIERAYQGCTDDKDTPGKKDPNNTGVNGGDLCYFDDNATVSLNGSSAELVKVAGSYSGSEDKDVQYRGTADDGSLIEMIKDGRSNGDVDGTYWRETTADGTQYYFGRDSGQGGSSAGTDTNSVFTAPVYSNNPDEPGYDADFAKSRNTRGWRWNLDYVVDRNGNTITYYYGKETGAYAREGDQDKRSTYDRGGFLKRIEYSSRSDAAASVHPGARVEFHTDDRCVGTCYDSGNKPVADAFPDTPWDQYCDTAPCTTQFSPTFWTQNRLTAITTQVYAGTGDDYTDVDSWTLDQTYLSAGGNEGSPMWLKSIVHKGLTTSAGGPAVTDPPVVFNPNADLMPNRVDSSVDGHSSLYRDRIQTVTTESGAQIGVTYSAKECTRDNLPRPWSNTMRCFPQYYGAEGETPKLDWFHKYVTTRVDIYDETGGFTHQQSNYDYLDKPAWAYDDSKLIKPKKRTWGQFRGYGDVRVRQGLETGVQSATEYRYFRGMDGDKQPNANGDLPPTGTPRSVSISDAYGTVVDHPSFAGMLREQIVTNGPGGDWVSGTVNTPEHLAATAVDGPLSAWPTHIASTRDRLKLSSGQTQWTSTQTTYDDLNYPTQVNDQGDEASTDDDRCSTLEYTRNPGANILGTVKRTLTVSLKCGTAYTPADVLADTRTYFDDPDTYGKAPTRGLSVRVDELDSWKGSDPQFVTTQKTVYDDLGRPSSVADALGHTTRTTFTPATSGPVTKAVVTDPLGRTVTTMLDRNLGVPLTTSDDANSAVTQMKYDGDGRLLAYWAPGRSSTANPDEPNATYTYQLRNGNAPTAVTTKTLTGYASKTYRTSIALYDGLLRKRQTQTQTVNGGRAILDTLYDSRGLVAATSNPVLRLHQCPTQHHPGHRDRPRGSPGDDGERLRRGGPAHRRRLRDERRRTVAQPHRVRGGESQRHPAQGRYRRDDDHRRPWPDHPATPVQGPQECRQ
ncbi:MAG: hypothetical protein QOE51_1732 [Actinoplanes sp.]|nr:hypothetical protein [Actinoplanes sp.]